MAGTGEKGYSGDGQRATDARIGEAGGIDVGPDGTLYIVDESARRVRAVTTDGVINTVAGTRVLRSPAHDGPMVNGWQYSPSDAPEAVAAGTDGTLYVAGRETIRRVRPDGSATMLATIDRSSDTANGLAAGSGGNIYHSGGRIERIDPAGKTVTVGGGGNLDPLEADGKPAVEARLAGHILSIAADAHGSVYLVAPRVSSVHRERSSLHRIDPDGILHTVAGSGEPGFAGDSGPAAKARVSVDLGGVAVGADGAVYVFDAGNRVVRVINPDGVINSIAPPVPAGGRFGTDLAIGPRGDVYVKTGARVYMLVRNATRATAQPAREPSYRPKFPNDAPGTVHPIIGIGGRDTPAHLPPSTSQGEAPTPRMRIAAAPDGSSYYTDAVRHRVMKVAADGTSSAFAGTGEKGFSGDGGPCTRAQLNAPTGLAVEPDGSVYIADSGNNRVRKVDPSGVITTIAGNGSQGDKGGSFGEKVTVHGDGGPATAATVTPTDIDLGPDGSLYIAEGANSRISKVAPDGTIRTLGGAGERWMEQADGHPAVEANFYRPSAISISRNGTVYLLDDGVETVRPAVRMIDPNGTVHTVAGNSYRDEAEAGFSGDGGAATKAELNNPHDIDTGPDSTLYIADTYNARIRAVDPNGTITTIAGTGQRADTGDGGSATTAALNEPQTLDVDANGTIRAINLPGDRIRRLDSGTITTAGTIATTVQPNSGPVGDPVTLDLQDITIDPNGNLLLADLVGKLYTAQINGTLIHAGGDTPDLRPLRSIALGPDGTRYIAAFDAVYRVPTDAAPVPIAGGGPGTGGPARIEPGQPATLANLGTVIDLAVSIAGRLYIATTGGVYRLTDDGTLATAFTQDDKSKTTIAISGIALDSRERLYVAVTEANRVYRVDANGERSTVATLLNPTDLAVDDDGTVYVGSFDGITRVNTDGSTRTVADNPQIDGGRRSFNSLVLDRHGDLYFIDHTRNQVKVLVQPGKITDHFNWAPVAWITAGALVLGTAGWFGLRWWRRRPTSREPTPDTEQAISREE